MKKEVGCGLGAKFISADGFKWVRILTNQRTLYKMRGKNFFLVSKIFNYPFISQTCTDKKLKKNERKYSVLIVLRGSGKSWRL